MTATIILLKISRGSITFSNLKGLKKVNWLGNYLKWTIVPLDGKKVYIMNDYY